MLLTSSNKEPFKVFDFENDKALANWYVVDDVVMGGRSNGNFELNEKQKGIFYGSVSLDNYGGFSSVRYVLDKAEIEGYSKCKIRLKGDGKKYQLRLKSSRYDRHSYKIEFETTGESEVIEIQLDTLIPTFRGRTLNMPNYPAEQLEEISFMISNKKAEDFRLELDWMVLE